jgi:endonuclease YncB( thermonuclease family)
LYPPVITIKGFFVTILFNLLICWSVWAWEGYVAGVPDGDSLTINQGGLVYEIRLYGIDCPEYGQSYWREARGFTRALALGETVGVEPMDTDQYGRVVALVWEQGQLVNSALVRNGLAWVYPRYCQAQPLCNEMKASEQNARKQGLGLWREKEPLAPWLWRQGRR